MSEKSKIHSIIDEFFKNLKSNSDKASKEDMDDAVESMQRAFEELRKRKAEEEQAKKLPK